MGRVPWAIYAPTHQKEYWIPEELDWKIVKLKVKRLQMRIAKAAKNKQYRKMRSLQWLLAHSRLAKLLAIRRVTSSKGKNTPGIDGVVWRTNRQKTKAIKYIGRRGYKAQPLRRVYIRKSSGKLRPLGIPTMKDRAMQALYSLTLEPVAETWADINSYGFRPKRCCADAITQCFIALSTKNSAPWILEADIKSCFDEINHQWLFKNIPIDKKILSQWLKSGFVDNGKLYPTLNGTPQGGVISPLLMNMTLDGLEQIAKGSTTLCLPKTTIRSGINFVRYADDFIITGKTKELLETNVLPAIKEFLSERGLQLSEEKTHVVGIKEGFNFLGQNVRKNPNGKMFIIPTKMAVQGLQTKIRKIMIAHSGDEVWTMIVRLNQVIRGWTNYHRHSCSSQIFQRFDSWLFWRIKKWIHKRHPNKGRKWLMKKYYRFHRGNVWSFYSSRKQLDGTIKYIDLYKAGWTRIVRHVKIRAKANPYDSEFAEYFDNRRLPEFRRRRAKGSVKP